MGKGTDALQADIINHLFGGAAKAQTTYRVHLLETVTDADAGNVTEIAGTGSGRSAAGGAWDWTRATNTAKNDTRITWANGSGGAWTVEGWGLWNAASAGQLDFYHTHAAITVNDGEEAFIEVDDLLITVGS